MNCYSPKLKEFLELQGFTSLELEVERDDITYKYWNFISSPELEKEVKEWKRLKEKIFEKGE